MRGKEHREGASTGRHLARDGNMLSASRLDVGRNLSPYGIHSKRCLCMEYEVLVALRGGIMVVVARLPA